ncbi:MAG: aspartate/glutamate racemase family protein [Celeribacter marinus]
MHLVYINPNATQAMTDAVVAVARAAVPHANVTGLTNADGPPAIEGPQDGAAALEGVLRLVATAQSIGADAIIIACFDDTGLAQARAVASCPVLGIGQAAYTVAALSGGRFSVVTSLPVSVPVIAGNIDAAGMSDHCLEVRASGLAVLDIDAGSEATRVQLADEIRAAQAQGCRSVVLGCAGMAPLRADLSARTQVALIDGVAASAHLAVAAIATIAPKPI